MSARRSVGSGGSSGVDFHRQHRWNLASHRIKVAGCTMTKAFRQSNQRGIMQGRDESHAEICYQDSDHP